MAFSGGWSRRHFYSEPIYDKLHVVGPEHSDRETADPNPVWDAPGDLDVTPEYMSEYPDADWLWADTPGVSIDMTPDSHDTYGGTVLNAPDQGAAREATYAAPQVQEYRERYLAYRFEDIAESPVSDASLRRGLTADPLNNPDGFRRGWVEQNTVDRKFMIGERFHDRRLNTVNTATVGEDGPPVPSTSGNPFRAMARAITDVAQKPMIRREPPPPDVDIVSDGSEDLYADENPNWVVG